MALRRSVARRGRASAPLDPEAEEWSIYVVDGEVNIAARHSMGAASHLSSGRPDYRAGNAPRASDISWRRGIGGHATFGGILSPRAGADRASERGLEDRKICTSAGRNRIPLILCDGWQHTIKIERSIHPLRGVGYPRPI
jgi:hypothetical protein